MPEEQAPPVVAVIVASDSGLWLEDCLRAISFQDYPQLSVLVIDAGSTIALAPRVAEVAPGFFMHRIEANPGFGPAANIALDLVQGPTYFLFCHDDVIPDTDAVRRMVEEAIRQNAGIVAPKLVDYNEPDRLLQLGLGVDRFGAPVKNVERHEFDQSQHDETREVFAAPGGCTLVRADLIQAIGGFDSDISMFGEDVDLCWRARIAGARVVVAPSATIRHLEATASRKRPLTEARALQWRHELRAVLKNYGPARRNIVVAQLAVLSFVEVSYFLLIGRRRRAQQVIDAWRWNLTRSRRHRLRRERRAIETIRRIEDREVAKYFTRGSFRLLRYMRPLLADRIERPLAERIQREKKRDFLAGGTNSRRRGPRLTKSHLPRSVAIATGLGFLILLIGSRSVIFGSLPLIGHFAPIPSPTQLLGEFFGGWQNAGMQRPGPASPAFGLLGLGGIAFLGSTAQLAKVGIIACIALGGLGISRLVRPFASPVACRIAVLLYLFLPLAWNDVARGDIQGLITYAGMPWVLSRLARATMAEPYRHGEPGAERREFFEECLGFGLLLGVIGAFVPAVILMTVCCACSLAIGSAIIARRSEAVRVLGVTAGSIVIAIGLCFPWSLTFFQRGAWLSALIGAGPANAGARTISELFRLSHGPIGAGWLSYGFAFASLAVIFFTRNERLDWALRWWCVGLGVMASVWAASRGWLGAGGGADRVLIVPLGCCFAVLIALGVTAIAKDIRTAQFGWRHIFTGLFTIIAVLSAFPVVQASLNGRWGLPDSGYDTLLSWLNSTGPKASSQRVLFLGVPEALPVSSIQIGPGLGVGISDGGLPNATTLWSGPNPGAEVTAINAIEQAESGRTVRLGERLATLGIRYIVVPTTLAPVLSGTQSAPAAAPSEVLLDALTAQQDLHELPNEEGTLVFENTSWHPGTPLPSAVSSPGGTPAFLRELGVVLECLVWIATGYFYLGRRRRRRTLAIRRGSHGAPAHLAKAPRQLVYATEEQ